MHKQYLRFKFKTIIIKESQNNIRYYCKIENMRIKYNSWADYTCAKWMFNSQGVRSHLVDKKFHMKYNFFESWKCLDCLVCHQFKKWRKLHFLESSTFYKMSDVS